MSRSDIREAVKARREGMVARYVGSAAQRPIRAALVAHEYGVHVGTVYKALALAGWPEPYGKANEHPKRRAVRMLYKYHNWGVICLAEAVGLSVGVVEKIIAEIDKPPV